jgi:predicted Zn-dependent protease with MMP-like domain
MARLGVSAAVGDVRSIWDPVGDRQNGFLGHARERRSRPPNRDNGGVMEMTREEFEELVGQALDRIPPELATLMDNVAVFAEDEPDPPLPEVFGLYEGTPLTERGEWYAGALPDRITVYRGPILRRCDSREHAASEIEVTVVHEVAHHFGIDDERLSALGYG